ncbi:uncharacterized protein LOC142237927 [Haematobia irritans]|uniref:uncharacterized protein LOC142237927 n=1 Tax=Haematobia irritans TaxID=7368 RepID=UPI003F4F8346
MSQADTNEQLPPELEFAWWFGDVLEAVERGKEPPYHPIFSAKTPENNEKGDSRQKKSKMLQIKNDLIGIKQEMKEIKLTINALRENVSFNFKLLDRKISSLLKVQDKFNPDNLRKRLGIERPFCDLSEFYKFDKKLNEDPQLLETLREILEYTTRSGYAKEAISETISLVMDVELQLLFSACGRYYKGMAKEKFIRTKLYHELNACFVKRYGEDYEGIILTETSSWLASARYRRGPRNVKRRHDSI